MSTARFTTITGDDWKHALPKARERRKQAPARMAKAVRLSVEAARVRKGAGL